MSLKLAQIHKATSFKPGDYGVLIYTNLAYSFKVIGVVGDEIIKYAPSNDLFNRDCRTDFDSYPFFKANRLITTTRFSTNIRDLPEGARRQLTKYWSISNE